MPTSAEKALDVVTVDGGYGSLTVVRGATFSLERGEALAVLGANGVGKTTLLRLVAGTLPARAGKVTLLGEEVTRKSVEQRACLGMNLVPEGRGLFPSLTVEDNLRIGTWACRGRTDPMTLDEVYDSFPVVAGKRGAHAGALSGGQQQLVAIVRALIARPEVLLLDEPSLGLSPRAVREVIETLGAQLTQGLSLVVAEQNVPAVLGVASRAVLMRHGVAHEIEDVEILRDRDVVRDLFL